MDIIRAAEVHLVLGELEMLTAVTPKPKPVHVKTKRHGGIKTTKADAVFSQCVRERTDWTCERCGTKYIPPTSALHCAHFHGRGKWATRTDPANCSACCYGCHAYFTANPAEFREWKLAKIGQSEFDRLEMYKNTPAIAKVSIRSDKDGTIERHYLAELLRMRELRAQGVTGRIEFVGWYGGSWRATLPSGERG